MPGTPSFSDESVVQRRKRGKIAKLSETVRKELKWRRAGRKGEKRIFHEQNEHGEVGSPTSRSVGYNLF